MDEWPVAVPFPRWQRARDRACAALLAGETRLLVTGPPGTGKTVFLNEIARVLHFAGRQVRTAGLLPSDGVTAPTGHQTVLLIDEADRLSDSELRELDASPHAALVLAGLDALRWEAGARISLSPLSVGDARDYAAQWLSMTGRHGMQFTSDAVERATELSGGIPRLLSSLLGASVWMASSEGSTAVTRQNIEDAAALRTCFVEPAPEPASAAPQPKPAQPRVLVAMGTGPASEAMHHRVVATRRRRVWVPAVAACVVGTAALGIMSSRLWSDRRKPVWSVQDELGAYIAQWRQAHRTPSAASIMRPVPAEPTPAAPVAAEPITAEGRPLTMPMPAATAQVHNAPIVLPEALRRPQERPGRVAQQLPPPLSGVMGGATVAGQEPKPQEQPVAVPPLQKAAEEVGVPPQTPLRAQEAVRPPTEKTAQAGTTARLSPALIGMLFRRGNEMLALGDLASARLLFARAAQAGDVNAMVALGRMYDQASSDLRDFSRLADRDAAVHWYRLAAAAGSAEAATLLHQIEQRSAK